MNEQNQNNDFNHSRHNGRIFAGLFLLFVGGLFILREMSFPFFPYWLFTWPMILIAIGIYTGFKHQFRNTSWIILIGIGSFFLLDEMDLGINLHRFIVPAIIIGVGLTLIFRPRRNYGWSGDRFRERLKTGLESNTYTPKFAASSSSEDFFDSTSIFSGTKKVILTKNLQGGDITCVFGGCEIDLSQADIQQSAVIDLNFIFGGGKIVVPSDWLIRMDITPVFGGIEDKRRQPLTNNPNKVLIIKGTCFFGGLEIKSY